MPQVYNSVVESGKGRVTANVELRNQAAYPLTASGRKRNETIDITVDDPKAYTRPWTVRVNQRLVPDSELIEFICAENQKFDQYLRGELRQKP